MRSPSSVKTYSHGGLNPYSNGTYSMSAVEVMICPRSQSLNPYSNGTYSMSIRFLRILAHTRVLILILMEHTL